MLKEVYLAASSENLYWQLSEMYDKHNFLIMTILNNAAQKAARFLKNRI